jgi:hypothetical protein
MRYIGITFLAYVGPLAAAAGRKSRGSTPVFLPALGRERSLHFSSVRGIRLDRRQPEVQTARDSAAPAVGAPS